MVKQRNQQLPSNQALPRSAYRNTVEPFGNNCFQSAYNSAGKQSHNGKLNTKQNLWKHFATKGSQGYPDAKVIKYVHKK